MGRAEGGEENDMKKVAIRVSQADLTDVLAKAAATESQRIEALSADVVDQIDGGVLSTGTGTLDPFSPPTTTVGFFPQNPMELSN